MREAFATRRSVMVQKVKMAMEEYGQVMGSQSADTRQPEDRLDESWKAPSMGRLKANWDAALNKKDGRLGMGVVIRDHEGGLVAAQCRFQQGEVDPQVAEALSVVNALSFCLERGVKTISIEGDARNVVEAVKSHLDNWSIIGHVVADAKYLCTHFDEWDINYMGRQANYAAHFLAKLAARMGINKQ
jgi:ribonuclease HI